MLQYVLGPRRVAANPVFGSVYPNNRPRLAVLVIVYSRRMRRPCPDGMCRCLRPVCLGSSRDAQLALYIYC
jgi:hypothetical protein